LPPSKCREPDPRESLNRVLLAEETYLGSDHKAVSRKHSFRTDLIQVAEVVKLSTSSLAATVFTRTCRHIYAVD